MSVAGPRGRTLSSSTPLSGDGYFYYSSQGLGNAGSSADLSEVIESLGIRNLHVVLILVQWFLEGTCACTVMVSPYLAPALREEFGGTHGPAAFVGSGVFFGSTVGYLIFGPLSDRFGRKATLLLSLFILGSASLLHLALPFACWWGFVLLRLVVGFSFGGIKCSCFPYLIEFLPAGHRGTVASICNLGWTWGTLCAILVVKHLEDFWRTVLAFPAVPALLSAALLAWAPESPRWCFIARYQEDGQRVMQRLFKSPILVEPQCPEPFEVCPEVICVPLVKRSMPWENLAELLGRKFRHATLAAVVVGVGIAGSLYAGVFALPTILKVRQGTSKFRYELYMMSEVVGLIGVAMAGGLADRWGRRFLLAALLLIHAACGVFIAVVPPIIWLLDALYLILSVCQGGIWPIFFIYTAEIFPTRIRATAYGIVGAVARISAASAPLAAAAALDNGKHGVDFACLLIVVLSLVAVGGVMAVPRETAHESIDDI
mmetsp:Transcript_11675/g.36413  ORF Transcript_11675/g.36413 Transcript_11675/m.36413 type:complete len:487 (+) Transcript_11675:123-1583(+)